MESRAGHYVNRRRCGLGALCPALLHSPLVPAEQSCICLDVSELQAVPASPPCSPESRAGCSSPEPSPLCSPQTAEDRTHLSFCSSSPVNESPVRSFPPRDSSVQPVLPQ